MDAHQEKMRHTVRVLTALVAAVLLVLTACSSTGGKPRSTGEGMAAGQADTPRFTIAMVTHGPPGDTFWDLIRKGAETAAAKDNIELKYSAELEAPNQANLVQNVMDSEVDALAVTLAKPEALAEPSNPRWRQTSRSWPSTRASMPGRRWASRRTSGRTRRSPVKPRASD